MLTLLPPSHLQRQSGEGCVSDALWDDGERGGESGDAVAGQLVQVVAAVFKEEPQKGQLLEPKRFGPHSARTGLDQPTRALLRAVSKRSCLLRFSWQFVYRAGRPICRKVLKIMFWEVPPADRLIL